MAITEAASSVAELFVAQWPFILTALVASAVAWGFQLMLKTDPVSKIPLVGSEKGDFAKLRQKYLTGGARAFYETGYRKFKDGLFRVPSPRESPVVVLAPHFLKELKDLPDDTVSFHGAIIDSMHTQYTNVRADREIIPFVVTKYLTPALTRLNPTVSEEVDLCFQQEMPPCKDFTQIPLATTLLRIIAKVSGCVFMGTEVGRSEEYVDAAINYTLEVTKAADAITQLPIKERPAKAAGLPHVKTLHERRQRTANLVRPLIEARLKAIATDPDYQKPDDLIQWVLDGGQKKFGKQTIEEVSEVQLGLIFAAIHTTSLTTTNALFTLAASPEMTTELREEITAVLKEHGTFTSAALQQMKKLDSFLREVMRMYPLSFASFQRKVLKPITLSTGRVIPAGVIIEVPSYSHAHDPEINENPDTFDFLRSYRAREQNGIDGVRKASAAAANQMVTVSENNLQFGFGRHACPGRFFAANEIKMIVGRALLDYEIALVGGATERYKNIEYNESCVPDMSKDLMFKRVAI